MKSIETPLDMQDDREEIGKNQEDDYENDFQ